MLVIYCFLFLLKFLTEPVDFINDLINLIRFRIAKLWLVIDENRIENLAYALWMDMTRFNKRSGIFLDILWYCSHHSIAQYHNLMRSLSWALRYLWWFLNNLSGNFCSRPEMIDMAPSPWCNPIIDNIHQILWARKIYWLSLAWDIISPRVYKITSRSFSTVLGIWQEYSHTKVQGCRYRKLIDSYVSDNRYRYPKNEIIHKDIFPLVGIIFLLLLQLVHFIARTMWSLHCLPKPSSD